MVCGGDSKVGDISSIIDVQGIIQDWAWDTFIKDIGYFRRCFIRRKDFVIDVPMNYYQFSHSDAVLEGLNIKSDSKTAPEIGEGMPNTSILATDYHNDTDMEQVYNFRMERARKASVSVTFQKGFTIGGTANFSVCGVDCGLEAKLEVTKTTEQTFEEVLTFETSCEIKVKENTNCEAKVIFTEKEMSYRFTVETTMRMPSGKAPVYIRRKKDKKVMMSWKIQDLRHIFHKYKEEKDPDRKVDFVRETIMLNGREYNNYAIKLTTKGLVEGTKLSSQVVELHAKGIDKKIVPEKKNDVKSPKRKENSVKGNV
ncbi:uncharacterized protein LOC124270037 [Haliotis rubra]|uniref:uncharacterized protein LOC124270037 n=1 Tax=Haliotis rubra TaxID=36100 RepID=UPI001EE5975F|nr:uncharacterized protein LOC124270037 [Haliotis rubra]